MKINLYDLGIRFIRRYSLFMTGGGLGLLLNLMITYILTEFAGLWYMFSYGAGAAVNILFNFFFHQKVTFKKNDFFRKRFAKFLVVTAIVFVISWFLVFLFTELFDLYYLFSIIIVTFLVSLVNFLLNRFWVFSKS